MNSLQETVDEGLGNLEGAVGQCRPEIVILRSIGVLKGQVADDAERDEPHLVEQTRLSDGSRLHVDSLGLGEVADNLAHLVLGVNKPVAGNDETRVKTDVRRLTIDGLERQAGSFIEQPRVSPEACGKPLHLSEKGTAGSIATIDVMIAELGADNNILNADALAMTTGTTAGNDDVGTELVDDTLSTQRGIDLTYATLLDADIDVAHKELTQLAQLLLHCYNYSYFHIYAGYALTDN